MKFLSALFVIVLVFVAAAPAQRKSISSVTDKLQKIEGFMPFYYDAESGKIYMEISRWNKEFLYLVSLPTGVGSNPIGLDRNQLGSTKVVQFERAGNKVLMVQPNYEFRASGNVLQKKSVEESFARSVIWGFRVEATDGDKVLVDATSFIVRDAHGVSDRINQMRQGSYNFDESRSAVYLPNTKGFPKNTEVEATVTLTAGGDTNNLVNQVTPTGKHVSVRQRHSFVELPDDNYKPRKFDPRTGAIPINFYDYGTDINEDLEKRWIQRFRLEKKDPNAAMSEAVKPIVFYVDNGAPKAIQDALVEGAQWWNQAYEAAGFRNAFQVRVLPADADPMDIRYNVINWVHRSTRGWSIGDSVIDPRTGEVLKGDVTLDSQRARQDFLLGAGMSPQYRAGAMACEFGMMPDVDYLAAQSNADEITKMSYARIRQLSAHEVGHTLGFTHNFAASTYQRGSVMDYPAPLVRIVNGKLDFSEAYAVGIGSFDKFATRYSYSQFPAGANEDAELYKIVSEGIGAGLLFLGDQDARPASAAQPWGNLWDNGPEPVASLKHEMNVRRIGLDQFGIRNIPVGSPMSYLENTFLPLYLHHRYQLTAAAKMIGGVYYTHAVRAPHGAEPGPVAARIPGGEQREALKAVLATIEPRELAIPDNILALIPPTAYGYGSGRSELFQKRTSPIFDPVSAAEIAADMTISAVLEPNRAARTINQNARDKDNPHFREIVDSLMKATWYEPAQTNTNLAVIQRAVQSVTATRLMELAANERANTQVRAVASDTLRRLLVSLKRPAAGDQAAFNRAVADDIARFLDRPEAPRKQTPPPATPPGDPIGN